MSSPQEPQKHVEIVEYDSERGIVAMYDEFTRSEYEVRAGMLDRAIRAAAIIELEKLGYTVLSPESEEEQSPVGDLIDYLQKRRIETLRVLRQCVNANADYWRWQGHAEMSRQLLERLGAEVPQ